MGLFDFLKPKSNKVAFASETAFDDKAPSDNEQLKILAEAISDVGYWSWWDSDLPDVFQIEFGGTQLYFPPTDSDKPPPTQIALHFKDPISINFISRNTATNDFRWTELLHEDKIEPPNCSHGEYSFGNSDATHTLLQQVLEYKTIHGDKPMMQNLPFPHTSLVFWAGDVGLAITANELTILNHTGDISLGAIGDINKKWWEYWRSYWDKRDTKDPLPEDYACEVTIPIKK